MEQLAAQLSSAVTLHALYPRNHPRLLDAADAVLRAANQAIASGGEAVTFLLIGDDLVVGDDRVVRDATLPVHEFIGILKRHGIERLSLAPGIDRDEALTLIGGLSSDQPPRSTTHVIVGSAQVVFDDTQMQTEQRKLSLEQLEVVREAWARFRVSRKLQIDQLEELVWGFIDSVGSTTRTMLPLANLKEHDEYTFIHSINVSLLVLAQARSFGIWGRVLHAFGMAGLLHDIGKLTVPPSILNKAGMLDDDEWELMKQHAAQGAWYLAEIEGTPPLSIIVAFEHHLRHDGRQNYPVLRSPRVPHLASKMKAIADAFDAVSASRPHQQPLARSAAFEVLRKRSGKFYDPLLVENFIRLFGDREH